MGRKRPKADGRSRRSKASVNRVNKAWSKYEEETQRIGELEDEESLNHCMRFVHYYRMGLVGQELAFAVKKYKSHREISPEQRGLIKSEFEKYWKLNSRRKVS